MKLPVIVKQVFDVLNGIGGYAVLRNYVGLPYENNSRDIDILIKKNVYIKVKQALKVLFEEKGYKIVSFFESERICTFVIGRIGSDIELLQFDFFFHTSAYGNILINSELMLKDREYENGIYHVSKPIDFLDKYAYLKFIGHTYPDKYNEIKKEALSNPGIDNYISEALGIKTFHELETMSCKQFRKAIIKYNYKHRFFKTIQNKIIFYKYYLANLFSPKGTTIGFTGPDGSGKTTIIELLISRLDTLYRDIPLYHFRPTLIGNLAEVAHNAGLKKDVDRDYNNPHRGSKTGILSSLFRLCYYSMDYLLGYYIRIHKEKFKRKIILFDRYYTDIICDSKRTRVFLPYRFLYWFGRLFIPSLDYNILLTAHSKVILARKQELDENGIRSINEKIDYLKDKPNYFMVYNEGTPDEAVSTILNYIFNTQHKKNLKRI